MGSVQPLDESLSVADANSHSLNRAKLIDIERRPPRRLLIGQIGVVGKKTMV
jgi:hypothetical protein